MEKGEQKRKNKGFSLVELIVVMAIMTIIATAIALAVIRYIEKGRIAMDVYNAGLIKDALNVYPFPSDFQGRVVNYEDPETGETDEAEEDDEAADSAEPAASIPENQSTN